MRRIYAYSLLIAALVAINCSFAADPKPPAQQRLLDRTPFDQVILNQANGGKVIEALPLTLTQRPLTAIPASGSLKMRLLERPTEEFEIAWTNVAQVRVFEQVLLAEAERLAAAGKFDEAYDYYARLGVEFPSLANLNESVCNYLRLNALALYRDKQNDRALALLITLHQRNPSDVGLPGAVEAVAGAIIQQYLHDGDYASARRVLGVWETQFENIAPQPLGAWQARFQAAASKQVEDANTLIGQKQYIPARKAIGRALAIWPNLPAADQTMAKLVREFPAVTVGVFETSPRTPTRRIDDWASLRMRSLLQPLLAEEANFGAEGGTYTSPFGEWNLDESGQELTLKVNGAIPADVIGRYLLALSTPGNPQFSAEIAGLLASVSLTADSAVVLHLKRIHVRPESLLQLPLPAAAAGAFAIAEYAPTQVVFAATTPAAAALRGPRAIVEQTLPDDEAAINALRSGDIDVLDRVPPWQVERLRSIDEIRVGTYKLPTVHVLIPNLQHPLLAKREFRRALCYGIDRKWILDRVLLGGNPQPGFELVSGPFPAGISLSDPIRYAYNNQVQPRSFEPRLAAILSTVAWSSVQNPRPKDSKDKPVEKPADTKLPDLLLVHPADPVARLACQSIQVQLAREGVTLKLRELTADELLSGKVDYDLRYAELAIWEPVADARQIFGTQGLLRNLQSPYIQAALDNVDTATNWKDVRARLAELHQLSDHELPIIPLWQTVNYFAYRASTQGIGDAPMTLYQNISEWSAAPSTNVARANN